MKLKTIVSKNFKKSPVTKGNKWDGSEWASMNWSLRSLLRRRLLTGRSDENSILPLDRAIMLPLSREAVENLEDPCVGESWRETFCDDWRPPMMAMLLCCGETGNWLHLHTVPPSVNIYQIFIWSKCLEIIFNLCITTQGFFI